MEENKYGLGNPSIRMFDDYPRDQDVVGTHETIEAAADHVASITDRSASEIDREMRELAAPWPSVAFVRVFRYGLRRTAE